MHRNTQTFKNEEENNGYEFVIYQEKESEYSLIKDIHDEKEETTIELNDEQTNEKSDFLMENDDIENPDRLVVLQKINTTVKEKDNWKDDSKYKSNRLNLKVQDQLKEDQTRETLPMENITEKKVRSLGQNERMVDVIIMEQNQLHRETINDIKTNIDPIVGYGQQPLLPLREACTPLIDIVHDILFYVNMSLNETPEEPSDQLTRDESAAIRLYTIEWNGSHRSLYSMINRTLKKGDRQDLKPYFNYMKLLLTALVKLPCIPQSTVWRGVTKDVSAQFPPGTSVIWWAFSSCTTALTVLENNIYLGNAGSRTLFSVEIINGRTIHNHSHFVTEDEILLLPATQMIVISQFSPAPDLHIIHLKQIKPEQTLLEPPFQGLYKYSKYFYLNKTILIFLGARLYPKTKRQWYRKKRFAIPLCLFTLLLIAAIILGSILGTRNKMNSSGIILDIYS